MFFDAVVAHDVNYGIGIDNSLAWNLPEDMAFFKALTVGKSFPEKKNIVIMGRKTFDSIPKKFRPLSNRINIVLSQSNIISNQENLVYAKSIEEALEISFKLQASENIGTIYCMGGKTIYDLMLPLSSCRRLYVTYLNKTFDCDAFLKPYDLLFSLIKESDLHESSTGILYQFKTFQSNLFDSKKLIN